MKLPVQNHPFIKADPFVLEKSEVISAVKDYLKREGYETEIIEDVYGVNLAAENEYHTLLIAAQGNTSELQLLSHKYPATQNDTNFDKLIVDLLKHHEKNPAKTLVLASPDTPLFRDKAEHIKQALDDLGIVRFWVKENGSIEWE